MTCTFTLAGASGSVETGQQFPLLAYDPIRLDHQGMATAQRIPRSPAFGRFLCERAAQRLAGTLLLVVLKAYLVPPTRGRLRRAITSLHAVGSLRRNLPRWGPSSASHTRGLRTGAASTSGHTCRTTLSSSPTGGACCRVWPTPLGRGGSTAVGSDPRRTPTSSGRQTPQRDVD